MIDELIDKLIQEASLNNDCDNRDYLAQARKELSDGISELENKLITAKLGLAKEEIRADQAEAMVQKYRGLIHSDMLAEMHYCELHEMAFQSPDHASVMCPHCTADDLRKEIQDFEKRIERHEQ